MGVAGLTDLQQLLVSMEPELQPGTYVFCAMPPKARLPEGIAPIGMIDEKEGQTVNLEAAVAASLDCPKSAPMRRITLNVHSSLEAVGLTAAFATELGSHGISANVVAGFYHDHIFVGLEDAQTAVAALKALAARSGR